MAGNTSKINLASNALLLLGDKPISSFEDTTTGAEVASNLYDSSYYFLLTTHRWRFSTKKQQLARLATKPKDEFSYKFKLPGDLVYLIKANVSDYEIYGTELFTNSSEVLVDYVYKVEEDKLPHYFIKAFEYYLASQFAIPVTGDIQKAQLMDQNYRNHIRIAKYADSSQRPSDEIDYNPYVDVRY